MHNPLTQFINWLREGYAEGVPPADHSPLLSVLCTRPLAPAAE